VHVCAPPSVRSHQPPALIGDSAATRLLREEIAGAARTCAKVLIVGETGTGKEVAARLIHDQSARRGGPFLAINCSGIAESLLESELFGHTRGSFTGADRDTSGLLRQANRGTLFLDELGEMSQRMQAVLLRFTETGEIQQVGAEKPAGRTDVRLVSATNRDLRAQIAAGAFREDLFYRLNVIQIRVPPLRDRGDDIMLLVDHYLKLAGATHRLRVPSVTPDVAQLLVAYAWPGNIRELKNITERLVLQEPGLVVAPDDLPSEIRGVHGGRVVVPAPRAAPVVALHQARAPFDGLGLDAAAAGERPVARIAHLPRPERQADTVSHLWDAMAAGDDFWAVVYRPFKARELTRTELAALVDRGLNETGGSYTALLKVFNLPPTDYKRFHAFLYQQECNLPVAPYRRRKPGRQLAARWVA
jgi:DNA-binding NtrC family response regulator